MKKVHIFDKKKTASITVEASLVLPIYIFSIMAFIYIIQIILLQEHIHSAMIQTGEYISQYAYVYNYIQDYQKEEGTSKEEGSPKEEGTHKDKNNHSEEGISHVKNIVEILFLQSKLAEYMDHNLINNSCIVGGTKGITMSGSSILENNDIIELEASYMLEIPFSFLGLKHMRGEQYLIIRGFTGYKPVEDNQNPSNGEAEDDKIVYITRTGTVYHLTEDCTHIRLDIRETQPSSLEGERNENGGKYYPCESCIKDKKENINSAVYITSSGDRYHSSISCSRLKRSVIKIWYSQVKDRKLCSRCGK